MTGVTWLTVMQTDTHHSAKPLDAWLIAPSPRLRDRLAARVRSHRLDEALARGTPAETNAVLALRARRLTRSRFRRGLARTLRRLIREAESTSGFSRSRIPPVCARVAGAADALNELADGLARPNPAAARGVAQAVMLLTDGTGPLFNVRCAESVRERAAAARVNLLVPAQSKISSTIART
jgi:hypothetical protein